VKETVEVELCQPVLGFKSDDDPSMEAGHCLKAHQGLQAGSRKAPEVDEEAGSKNLTMPRSGSWPFRQRFLGQKAQTLRQVEAQRMN